MEAPCGRKVARSGPRQAQPRSAGGAARPARAPCLSRLQRRTPGRLLRSPSAPSRSTPGDGLSFTWRSPVGSRPRRSSTGWWRTTRPVAPAPLFRRASTCAWCRGRRSPTALCRRWLPPRRRAQRHARARAYAPRAVPRSRLLRGTAALAGWRARAHGGARPRLLRGALASALGLQGALLPMCALPVRGRGARAARRARLPSRLRRGARARPAQGALPLRGRALRHALGIIDPLRLRKRRLVATSRDSSWRIYDRYARDPARPNECLQPVFDPGRTRGLEVLLPDRLRLVPGRPGYFARAGFAARGLPDLAALGCEEFLWRDEPFGFHVRSQPKRKAAGSVEHPQARIAGILDDIAQRNGLRSRPADVDAEGLR